MVRLLGLSERLLIGIQHRIVELLASLLRAGEADVVVVAAAVLVLRHGDKGPFLAADDLHAANGKYVTVPSLSDHRRNACCHYGIQRRKEAPDGT